MGSLLRKRFVYNPETGKMDEIAHQPRSSGLLVMQDLPDFVSPVDGKVVHGRRGLREHDKRNGTTNIADFQETWKKNAAERAKFYTGRDDPKRIEQIRRAYDDLKEGRVKRNRNG
ncbi:MAG TPA: hypothetical protein VFV92_07135 [Candidatus Bathyarchaeia archaeon]|nr:hypothetical protein [Candidatus Bathyarchaeia archaeon]